MLGLLCTGVDITERLKAEERRLALERQMQQAQKRESLATMAGAIAHHFNNQLTPVLGYLALAKEFVAPQSTIETYLLEAEGAAKRAAELGRLMLTYVGQEMRQRPPINLAEIVQDILPEITPKLPEGISLETEIPDAVSLVRINSEDARKVVLNLVTNAWEAINGAKGILGIALREGANEAFFEGFNPTEERLEKGPWVCLEITDTGPGMDRKTLERLFDPFFSTKFTGRGLGMAVTLGIVQTNDGVIVIKSAPGKGTTVRVFFPAYSEESLPVNGIK